VFGLHHPDAVEERFYQHHRAGGILLQCPRQVIQHLALFESGRQFVFRLTAVYGPTGISPFIREEWRTQAYFQNLAKVMRPPKFREAADVQLGPLAFQDRK
jgi:hypothetical protein